MQQTEKDNKFFEEMICKGFFDKLHNMKLITDSEHKNCISGYDEFYKDKDAELK